MIIERIKSHLAIEYEKKIIIMDDDLYDLFNSSKENQQRVYESVRESIENSGE